MIKLAKVTKTKRDEEKWEKAHELAEKAGKKDNYAYIMGIYKKMKPDYKFKTSHVLQRYIRQGLIKTAFRNDLPSYTFPAKVTEVQQVFMPYLSLCEVDDLTEEVLPLMTDTTGYYYDSIEEFEETVLRLLGKPEKSGVRDLGNGFLEYHVKRNNGKTLYLTVNVIIDFIGTMPLTSANLCS